MGKLLLQNFADMDKWVRAKLARAPVPGDEVFLIRQNKNSLGAAPIPKTTVFVPDESSYVIKFGDHPLILHHRDETVILNLPEKLQSVLQARVAQFSPFIPHGRSMAPKWWSVDLPPKFGVYTQQTYHFNSYRRGWVFRGRITLRRTKEGGWEVDGKTLDEAGLALRAQNHLSAYARNYIQELIQYNFGQAHRRCDCAVCEIEADGKPMYDIINDPVHWQRHVVNWQYPKSLICRLVFTIPDADTRKRIALIVNRGFGPPQKKRHRLGYDVIDYLQIRAADQNLMHDMIVKYLHPRIQEKEGA